MHNIFVFVFNLLLFLQYCDNLLNDMFQLARQSFPLCMRQLHAKLRQDHKLRHSARLQYALFLKGIGVTLEDIMTMWREEWAKVEPEKVH